MNPNIGMRMAPNMYPLFWVTRGMLRIPVPTMKLNRYARPTYNIESRDLEVNLEHMYVILILC